MSEAIWCLTLDKRNMEDVKELSWTSLKFSAAQSEFQPLCTAAKHDIVLARLGASNNALEVNPVLKATRYTWRMTHYWDDNLKNEKFGLSVATRTPFPTVGCEMTLSKVSEILCWVIYSDDFFFKASLDSK